MRAARLLLLPAIALLAALPLARPSSAMAISACAAAGYHPAEQPPFGGEPVPPLRPVPLRAHPRRHRLSARQAVAIAAAAPPAIEEARAHPTVRPRAFTQGPCRWRVSFYSAHRELARVAIDDRSGAVLEAWRGQQVGAELARGYRGAVAQHASALYVWLPLCLLFFAAFFDPRRPLRLLHLDLLVLLSFSFSLIFFNRGEILTSVPLTYPVLAYIFVRMIWEGLRPRGPRGPLFPWAPARAIAVVALALAGARIALNVVDSHVIDIGVAGVIGAHHIAHGQALYSGAFAPGINIRGDVYGPFNYLAYVPFELLFPWHGVWDSVPAAHAAAISFDLLTALGLLALGRRLRGGGEGRELGLALAFGWLAYPFTLYTMNANADDSLIALLLVGALLVLASAPARGVMVALGAAAKFGSAALAPLFATARGERRVYSAILFSIAFLVVAALLILPFLPHGGLREFYDRTLGYQTSRNSAFSVWGLAPSLKKLQPLVRAGAVALALLVAFVPRRKSAAQIAALGAAVLIAVQVGANHWFYFYIVWFLPLVLVAILTRRPAPTPGRR